MHHVNKINLIFTTLALYKSQNIVCDKSVINFIAIFDGCTFKIFNIQFRFLNFSKCPFEATHYTNSPLCIEIIATQTKNK
jgi:hypothetical protein